MIRRRYRLGGAMIVAGVGLPGTAMAQQSGPVELPVRTPDTISIMLPASIDGVAAGALFVGVTGEEIGYIQEASWRKLADGKLAPSVVDEIASTAIEGQIAPAALEANGMRFQFNLADLTLNIYSEEEQRAIRPLSLQPSSIDYTNASQYPGPDPSAYLNIFADQSFIEYGGGDGFQSRGLEAALDGAARIFGERGPAVEWSGFYEENAQADRWRRGDVRIVLDDVKRAIRYSAGDIQYRATEFQGAPPMLGVSIERQFDEIHPLSSVTPTGQQTFNLTRRSRVEVYVNGFYQRTLSLEPGRYQLSDFAFNSGVNDVTLRIEDVTGAQQVLDFSLFSDAQLLKSGLSEFSVNLGVRRQDDTAQRIEYDTDRPAWSAFYRRGVTDSLTVGVDYQGDDTLHVYGASAAVSSPFGIFSVRSNVSDSSVYGQGSTTIAQWSYDIFADGGRRPHEFDIAAVIRSEDYINLGRVAPSNVYKQEMRARYTAPLPYDALATVTARHARPFAPLAFDETAYGLSLTKSFRRFSASVSAEYAIAEREETNIQFRLSVPLGARQNVAASYDGITDRGELQWSRFSRNAVGDLSGHVALRSTPEDYQAEFEARYLANRFEALVSDTYVETIDRRPSAQTLRVRGGTSIAMAGGKVAVGRPIYDSFALVSRHDSLGDTNIRIQDAPGDAIAIAGDFGPAVVPSLNSYMLQRISWSAEELPLGYDMGDTTRDFLPRYRSGAAFTAGSSANIMASGSVRDASGEPLVLIAGVVRPDDGRPFAESRTFTNRQGTFVAVSLEPGAYVVEFMTTPPSRYRFEVETTGAGVVRLGELTLLEE